MSEKTTNETKSPNIYQRINAVMRHGSYIEKSKLSTGAPYKSVSHDTVTSKIGPAMQEHGIVMVTDVVELMQEGNRTQVKLSISFINIDDPKDKFTVNFYGHGIDTQDKGVGKAISYAVKYCLIKTFMLQSGTEDDVESHNIEYQAQSDQRVSKSDVQHIELLINGHHDLRKTILSRCDGSFSNMTLREYELGVQWVKNTIAKMNNKIEATDA